MESGEKSPTDAAARAELQRLEARIAARRPRNFWDLDSESRMRTDSRALGVLSPGEQRRLVRLAQGRDKDDPLRQRAAEMLVLTNYGFVRRFVREHESRGLELEVLRQECFTAIYDAIDRFDLEHDSGSSFLAYCEWRMKGAVTEAVRNDSRLVRLKSRASEISDRLERAIKLWEGGATVERLRREFPRGIGRPELLERAVELAELVARGQSWTPQLLSELTGDRVERVLDVLPWLKQRFAIVRLDAPLPVDRNPAIADLRGPFAPDIFREAPATVDVEGETLEQATARELREVVSSLPLYQRRLLELHFGLEGEPVERERMVSGVYRDEEGLIYSAEQSVIASHHERARRPGRAPKREELARTAKQRELDRRYLAGELRFEPESPEARELYRLSIVDGLPEAISEEARLAIADEHLSDDSRMLRELAGLNELAGVPPTTAALDAALERCYEILAPRLQALEEHYLYRGDDMLVNSRAAFLAAREEMLRRAQQIGGVVREPGLAPVSAPAVGRLEQPRYAGRNRMQRLAESLGVVDERGRLTFLPGERAQGFDPKEARRQMQERLERPVAQEKARPRAAKVKPLDLMASGHLAAGEVFSLRYKGQEYRATLLEDGRLELDEEQKRVFSALSSAAEAAKGVQADPGWNSWRALRDGQWVSLYDIRKQHLAGLDASLRPQLSQLSQPSGLPEAAGAPAVDHDAAGATLSP